jgi:cytochrome c biogenesis protein CcmG/thiol:disulfide interchange protein DsbE
VEHNLDPTPGVSRSGILLSVPRVFAITALAVCCAFLAACGGAAGPTGGITSTTSTADKQASGKRLATAPPALRANLADANTIAGDGEDALNLRLAGLKGHPVVVNQWASWCGPCRAEFPLFADAVVAHGSQVAFLGIDFNDDRDAATKFLRQIPPGFASIYDQKGDASRSLGGGRVAPTTFFIGSDGKRRYTKLGNYPDAAALEADIRRYAR